MRNTPPPDRIWCEGAAAPIFIVHGHRLSSLYRTSIRDQISFIVLKILKLHHQLLAVRFEYFWNNENRVLCP